MFAAGTVKCVAETSNVRQWEQIQVFASGTVKCRKYNVLQKAVMLDDRSKYRKCNVFQKAVMLRANTGVCLSNCKIQEIQCVAESGNVGSKYRCLRTPFVLPSCVGVSDTSLC